MLTRLVNNVYVCIRVSSIHSAQNLSEQLQGKASKPLEQETGKPEGEWVIVAA